MEYDTIIPLIIDDENARIRNLIKKYLRDISNIIKLDPPNLIHTIRKWKHYILSKLKLAKINEDLIDQEYIGLLINALIRSGTCKLCRRHSMTHFNKIMWEDYTQSQYKVNNDVFHFRNIYLEYYLDYLDKHPKFDITHTDVRSICNTMFDNIERNATINQVFLGNGEPYDVPFHLKHIYYNQSWGMTKYQYIRSKCIVERYQTFLRTDKDIRTQTVIQQIDDERNVNLSYEYLVKNTIPEILKVFTVPKNGSLCDLANDIFNHLEKNPILYANPYHNIDAYEATRIIINNLMGYDHDGETPLKTTIVVDNDKDEDEPTSTTSPPHPPPSGGCGGLPIPSSPISSSSNTAVDNFID